MDTIDKILEERGSRYGAFSSHARITQEIKQVINLQIKISQYDFMADQVEALEMIAHKIGRILNGDPDYIDSWDDIAGYAKLVADRLRGQER